MHNSLGIADPLPWGWGVGIVSLAAPPIENRSLGAVCSKSRSILEATLDLKKVMNIIVDKPHQLCVCVAMAGCSCAVLYQSAGQSRFFRKMSNGASIQHAL